MKQVETGDFLYEWSQWTQKWFRWTVTSVTPKRAILQLGSQKHEIKRQSTSNIFTSTNRRKESFVYGCEEMEEKYQKQELASLLKSFDYAKLSLSALKILQKTVDNLENKN